MAFDWQTTLTHYGVAFATSGKNVSKHNFVVHCPFCGAEDQGMHMSVSTDGKGWRCFRRVEHRGRRPHRLLAALLNISIQQAARLVGDSLYVPSDILSAVQAALGVNGKAQEARKPPAMPSSFAKISTTSVLARPGAAYLERRGFTDKQIDRMTERYGLRYCRSGSYKGRVIFPVVMDGELKAWTGRHVGSSDLRYKSLSADPEKANDEGFEPALGPISDYLLFYDRVDTSRADTLYLCEGPFDALKVDVLAQGDAVATCFFTAAPSRAQVDLLFELIPTFKYTWLMLDRGTLATALRVRPMLTGLNLSIAHLPEGVKDPGDLTQRQFDKLHERNLRS